MFHVYFGTEEIDLLLFVRLSELGFVQKQFYLLKSTHLHFAPNYHFSVSNEDVKVFKYYRTWVGELFNERRVQSYLESEVITNCKVPQCDNRGGPMGQILHGSARTTGAVCRAI